VALTGLNPRDQRKRIGTDIFMRDDNGMSDELEFDLTPSPRLLSILGEFPMKNWQAIAELVDNCFDAFPANYNPGDGSDQPRVDIIPPNEGNSTLIVRDNGAGMNRTSLEASLKAGYSGKSSQGAFGLFGVGFNIATAVLGTSTTVRTTRAGDSHWLEVVINPSELRKLGTFKVPCSRHLKEDDSDSGTEIVVQLEKAIADKLRTKQEIKKLRTQLGDVYSYLLRTEIPGIANPELSGPRNYMLVLGGDAVPAKLPCVWSESRTVKSGGEDVSAVQEISQELSPAWACLDCGEWDRTSESLQICAQCGSNDVALRERRIRGWLGIQRYLDTQHYGVDFLRNGRKILINDKSLFSYEDPDTGVSENEYPVEQPANKGRIVGEVHLDHVSVVFSKNDFKRAKDWQDAREAIRGESPLKPRARKDSGPNTSPLGKLFKGFRRNDGGRKYLFPGNGEKATTEKAAQWGALFHSGDTNYYTDDVWWKNVEEHERIKAGDVSGERDGAGFEATDDGSDLAQVLGGAPVLAKPTPESQVESDDERYVRFRANGYVREDLSGPLNMNGENWSIKFWVTEEKILAPNNEEKIAEVTVGAGNNAEVFVCKNHRIFRNYGRDVREYGLLEVAAALATGDHRPMSTRLADLIEGLPDQVLNSSVIAERINGSCRQIADLLSAQVEPSSFWDVLSNEEKVDAETRAAAADPALDWQEAVAGEGFIKYLSMGAVAAVVEQCPHLTMDGKVFTAGWATWNDNEAKRKAVARIVTPLKFLGLLQADPATKSVSELQVARLMLDEIEERLSDPVT